ncbi:MULTISPECIES: hypothetical protein [Bacillus]|uniref:hypothetical protein n=1 Tax=Bacillus TaxID=1386 RepID=UPI000993F9EE|nr:hypothetical protein [Bacillus mycoides]MED1286174.1 hypothetical protein [Bacillus mycoides]OOQ99879.1 hypothetical protein BW899_14885 [Bacillus mycoides]HDR7586555.1 hypothetical protein [Bacillus mycoides]
MEENDNKLFNPLIKTLIFAGSVVISGVLCSAFVTEITDNGIVRWGNFYKVKSFWLIAVFLIVVFIYNSRLYKEEKKIEKFYNEVYCSAFMKSELLPAIAEYYKQEIQKGNLGQLKEAKSVFKDLME